MKHAPWFGACRLWLDAAGSRPNIYMALRRNFTVTGKVGALTLRIAADSDFVVWLDGVEIGRGQFSDDSAQPTWSDFAVAELAPGNHALAVLAYHKGISCAVYAPGDPGVVFALFNDRFRLVSDAECRVLEAPGFRSGPMPLLTPQLGFTAEFDARRAGADWRQAAFDDAAWRTPQSFDLTLEYRARPLAAVPRLQPFQPARLIHSGLLIRRHDGESTALTMVCDQVFRDRTPQVGRLCRSEAVGDGWALIYDLGGETVGFVEFALTAPAGTVVDFAHGEHLDDGRVRMECFGRNFADRYICRGGKEAFQLPFRRIGARYLEFHVIMPEKSGEVEFHRVGVCPWVLPLPEAADFDTPDEKLLTVRRLAIRTLELCMHEHYEDCPWREQALYTYDSRNQMLYGYYLWGNWDFAAASLRLFATVLRDDGHLRICAPGRLPLVIPIFSTIWARQMWEHALYSGDDAVWREHRAQLCFMREKFLSVRDAATGLAQARDPEYWTFYEWAPGLCGGKPGADEVHALYNLYLANMLEAMARLEAWRGDGAAAQNWREEAASLRRKVEELFYDPASGCYATRCIAGKRVAGDLHEHVQIMMLHAGIVPEAKLPRLLAAVFAGNDMVPITLSVMPYLLEALLGRDYGPDARRYVRRKLEENYYPMLDGKSTTLWETVKGGDDFVYAGSLCHGWSSLPVYYCGAGLLGVTPLAPGFRRFQVRPWADGREAATGEIPTPAGPIRVEWRRNAEGGLDLTVEHPAVLTPEVAELADSPLGKVVLRSYQAALTPSEKIAD